MGKVIMSGIVPLLTKPSMDISSSNIAVGSTVKLLEHGAAVEYLVVNQGIPGNNSLYDESCDGMWILRKECVASRAWDDSADNVYSSSSIHQWLIGDFFNGFGSIEKATIKQVKIPYGSGAQSSTVNSGGNGLSTKAFLLGANEISAAGTSIPKEGSTLDYFNKASDLLSKGIAYLNGTAVNWWLRSPVTDLARIAWYIDTGGGISYQNTGIVAGIRPALVLPKNAVFDSDTMLLKGVA